MRHEKPNHPGTDDQVQALLQSVRGSRTWTDEEVLELAYDPSHLAGEQLFDYWEGKLDAAGRATVEDHAAHCDFCLHQFSAIGRLVVATPAEPVLVRLVRRVRESIEELGRLTATAGKLVAAGSLAPRFRLAGSVAALDMEPASGQTFTLEQPLPSATPEAGLHLSLVVQVRDGGRCDLKVMALALEETAVAGIRLTVASPTLDQPLLLESDDWGLFRPLTGGEEVFVRDLPLDRYHLRLQLPGSAEELEVDIADLQELCRKGIEAAREEK